MGRTCERDWPTCTEPKSVQVGGGGGSVLGQEEAGGGGEGEEGRRIFETDFLSTEN